MKGARAALAAACVLVPVWAWSPTVPYDWRLDGALLGLLVLALALTFAGRRLAAVPGTVLFLAALGAGLLPLALDGSPPPVGGLADRAALLSGWTLVLLAGSPATGVRRALPWVLAGCAAASAYGLVQILGWDPLGFRPEPHSPPVAPFANSNVAAEVLAPLLVTWVAARRLPAGALARLWPVLGALMAFHVGFLGVTAARLSLPLGCALALRRDRGALRLVIALLLVFAAGEGTRFVLAEGSAEPAPAEAAAEAARAPAEPFATARVRWEMWRATVAHAFAAPLGVGLGRFEARYPEWRPSEELRLSSQNYADSAVPRPATPHNEAVLALSETGWLGLLLVGLALWRAWRGRPHAAWSAPGLLALAVHAMVRAPLSHDPAALALGALLLGAPDEDAAPTEDRKRRWVAGMALGLAALAAVAAPFQIGGELGMARRFESEEPQARVAALRDSLRWRPWNSVAWVLLAADARAAAARVEEREAALLEALRYDPANLAALTGLFRLEAVELGDEVHGLAWLRRAETVAPRYPVVRGNRTLFLEIQAGRQRQVGALLMQAGDPDYRDRLFAADLLDALVAARRADLKEARRELRASLAKGERYGALIERTLRHEDFGEGLVRHLCLRLLPEVLPPQTAAEDWETVLGPAPD